MNTDQDFLRFARYVAQRSPDPSTQVGAVIVRPDGSMAAYGYNRFPEGYLHDPEDYANREYKYRHIRHAEEWALRDLNETGETANGCTVYTSFPCCPDCVELLANAGVVRAVSPPLPVEGKSREWVDGWKARLVSSLERADALGFEMVVVDV